LVDGLSKPNCEWSAHKTDIYQAIAQGCRDRYGKPLRLEAVRAGCLDDEMWAQEFSCQFISTATQWIPPELFEANVSAEATAGHPAPGLQGLYAGWDVARSTDMSVIWLTEVIGDVSWVRGVIELSGTPTPVQMDEARALMPMIRRMAIDRSSMGLTIFEQLDKEFPGKVEGVLFTQATKEALAVQGKRRMEEKKVRLPDTDVIRNSFRSVKKLVTATGQARFDAARDERYGHADHWWAFCLAEVAAQQAETIFPGIITSSTECMGFRECECEKCGHCWSSEPAHVPKLCPRCGSARWESERLFERAVRGEALNEDEIDRL
jgi:phage FluMu gp28-like protein